MLRAVGLLLQVLGVIAVSVAVPALAAGRFSPRLDRRAVALVAGVVATLLFWANVGGDGKHFADERADLAGASQFDATVAIGRADGQNVRFLGWANDRMGPGDTFAILPADLSRRVDRFIPYGWSTFQLSPHRSVAQSDADWLVFYGVSPDMATYDRSRFEAPLRYGRLYAIARRRSDAG
jgi:hypothetical protein